MAVNKGKKPTNKDRDKAIGAHDAVIREIVPKYNSLYNQVQDFFAVFSMFVEMLGKDDEFGEYVTKKVEEAKNEQESKAKELDKEMEGTRDVPKDSPVIVPVDKVVADES